MAIGINNISLKLELNEFVVIYGESGSGKTTLANIIGGIDSYEEGELLIEGKKTSGFSIEDFEKYRRSNVGFVFQNYQLIDSLTALQNVMIALKLQGLGHKECKAQALEILDKVKIKNRARNKASKLSGGEKQRCSIARALAGGARVIVCDEITGNLDSKTGEGIINLLHELSSNRLIIMVTHNPEAVKHVATRMIRMLDGKIVEDRKIGFHDTKIAEQFLKPQEMKISFFKELFFALTNILATPRKTLFILLTFILLIIAVSKDISIIQIEELTPRPIAHTLNSRLAFNSKSDNYLFVTGTEAHIDTSNALLTQADYMAKENFLFYTQSEYSFEEIANPLGLRNSCFLTPYFSGKLVTGSMPRNGEILLGVDEGFYELETLQALVGQAIHINTDIYTSVECKIAGTYIINRDTATHEIYMPEGNYLDLQKQTRYEFIANDYVVVDTPLRKLYFEIVRSEAPFITVPVGYPIDAYKMLVCGQEFDYKQHQIAVQFSALKTKDYFQISIGARNIILEQRPSYVTLYYNSPSAKAAAHKELSKDDSLLVIDPLTFKFPIDANTGFPMLSAVSLFIMTLLAILGIWFFASVAYLTLKFVVRTKIKDYDIYRTLGLPKRNLRRVNRYEFLFINIVASAIVVVASLFPDFRKTLGLQFHNIFLGILLSFFVVLYVVYIFDRRLYKFTVGYSLKAGDFLD